MRVVLTIPDDVVTVEVYVKSKNEAITYSRIFEGGSITNSRFIDKEETMGMRYSEGLEKRIDALEAELREEIPRRFGVAHETFVKLDEKVEALGRTVDSLDKWTDATDGQLKEIENRLAKLEKPCVDMETIVGAIGAPKLKPIPEPLENRGPYTDILRRLGALEKRANVARADITKIMGHKVTLEERVDKLEERAKVSRPTWEHFDKLVERIEGLEGQVEPIESLLDKGEDGAYPFLPTFKDYAEIKQKIDALEKDAKVSRPTWDNFSLHDQRICKLEQGLDEMKQNLIRAKNERKFIRDRLDAIEKILGKDKDGNIPYLPKAEDWNEVRKNFKDAVEVLSGLQSRLVDVEKNAEVARGVRNITANEVKDLKIRLEDAEKKAAIAESVRKQLAEDIKAIQGRINKICEETCVDA